SLTLPAAFERVEPIQQAVMTETTAPLLSAVPGQAQDLPLRAPLTPSEVLQAYEIVGGADKSAVGPINRPLQHVTPTQPVETGYQHQRVLHVDPANIMSLVQWHIAMMTRPGTELTIALEVLNRVCWQLRHEGERDLEAVTHEYHLASEANPHNAGIHFAWGQMLQKAGEYDKAIDAYMVAMDSS